jgi:hypothetical protein
MPYILGKGKTKNLKKRRWTIGRQIQFSLFYRSIGIAAETGRGELLGIHLTPRQKYFFDTNDAKEVIQLIRKNCKTGGRVKIFGNASLWKHLVQDAYNFLVIELAAAGPEHGEMLIIESEPSSSGCFTVELQGGDIDIAG